jgi:hypothetical protein
MSTAAQHYIDGFERGDEFKAPASGLTVGGQPDDAAIEVLSQHLRDANAPVRENIVRLLVDLGKQTDPMTPKGAEVLRNRRILAVLAGPGFAKADVGRQAAIDALRRFSLPADLARIGDELTKALSESPTEDCFLLIAKAKPPQARELVFRLAESPSWNKTEAARIARAAYGDGKIEREFLTRADHAEAASNGQALADAVGALGLIGTQGSLKAVARRLRTPLTIELKGTYIKSVRLDVLAALLYNYPDQPALYPNNIVTEQDYLTAERFCTRTLGVEYSAPEPAFLTYRGYPIPRLQ